MQVSLFQPILLQVKIELVNSQCDSYNESLILFYVILQPDIFQSTY